MSAGKGSLEHLAMVNPESRGSDDAGASSGIGFQRSLPWISTPSRTMEAAPPWKAE